MSDLMIRVLAVSLMIVVPLTVCYFIAKFVVWTSKGKYDDER